MGGGRRRVVGVASIGALAVLSFARAAVAAPTSRLVYVRAPGAESCPDEAELRSAVAGRLGYDPFRPFAPSTLTVEVKRAGKTFKGNVRLVDEGGVERGARDLESNADSCADLTTALALSMSIAIDPLSALAPPPAKPLSDSSAESSPPTEDKDATPPPPPETRPPEKAPAKEAPSPPRREARERPGFALGLGAHGALGSAPSPAFGMRAGVELASRRLSIGAEGRLDLPASEDTSEGGSVAASMIGGSIVPCSRFGPLAVCGVLFFARAAVESRDITTTRSEGLFFFAGGMRLAGDIELGAELRLRLFAEALGNATPYELAVNGRNVYRLPSVSGSAGLSVLRFF